MANMEELFLIFAMQLDETQELNRGRLALISNQKGLLGRWVATSGLGAYQGVGDWDKKGGGVLPATYQLEKSIPFYEVATEPIDLSGIPGVEGSGYCITPFDFTTQGGTDRGDVLIHADRRYPGTLGCIGVKTSEYADFERTYKWNISRLPKKVDKLKLWVIYTY
jgi:hypothetical protein